MRRLNRPQTYNATMRRVVGISCDAFHKPRELGGQVIDQGKAARRYMLPADYVMAVHQAGGLAVLLPHDIERIGDYLALCDAFVLAGGDDPDTSRFGQPVHPQCILIDADRQRFELALLARLDQTDHRVLGVCLGMQLMALHAGGSLHQSIADDLGQAIAMNHMDTNHRLNGTADLALCSPAIVHSCHRQAIADPGNLAVTARSDDDVIEAIAMKGKRFYLGVQWHPERTEQREVGVDLFRQLIAAA